VEVVFSPFLERLARLVHYVSSISDALASAEGESHGTNSKTPDPETCFKEEAY